jgi:hypothetical protein
MACTTLPDFSPSGVRYNAWRLMADHIEAALRDMKVSAARVLELVRSGVTLTEEQYRLIRQIAGELLYAVRDWEET